MKQTYFYTILLSILVACSQTNSKDLVQVNNKTIEHIASNVQGSFSSSIDLDSIALEELTVFSSSFLKKYIANRKVGIGFQDQFKSEYPESFYFYQGKQYQEFYLLTFIHTDESCCTSVYGATFSNSKDALIDVAQLAYKGADGGWFGKQTAVWIEENKLNVFEYSIYDEDLDEMTNNAEVDSVWKEIKLNNVGEFTVKEIKSVSRVGGTLLASDNANNSFFQLCQSLPRLKIPYTVYCADFPKDHHDYQYSDSIQKYLPEGANFMKVIDMNESYISLLVWHPSDFTIPGIVTLDLEGNVIDEKGFIGGYCGSDFGYFGKQHFSILNDYTIIEEDTMIYLKMDENTLGILDTTKVQIERKTYRVNQNGMIKEVV